MAYGHYWAGSRPVLRITSGDVLEVEIRSVDLAIPYGYDGCSGFLPELCDRRRPTTRIIRLDRRGG